MQLYSATVLLQAAEKVFAANTAGAFVNQYRNITVPGFVLKDDVIVRGGPPTVVSAEAYVNDGGKVARSNPDYITPGKRRSFRDLLLSLKDSDRLAEYVSFAKTGSMITVSSNNEELFQYTPGAIGLSFVGKGTPNQVAMTATLMNLWRVFMLEVKQQDQSRSRKIKDTYTKAAAKREETKKAEYTHRFEVRSLKEMVGEYLGVDCNGFANIYLKSKYPALDLKASTMEDSYVQHTGRRYDKKRINRNLRLRPSDIQQDDAVIFYRGHFHHIAVVNTVFRTSPDRAVVNIAESRGSAHGGVQTNTWEIKLNKKGRKETPGDFQIVGRNEDYVKIVSPQRWNFADD